MNGADNRQVLADVYKSSPDVAVKRAILRSFMVAGDRERLLAVAKTETAPELRGEAVQQLGVMNAGAELNELYQTETSVEVKKRILQAMFVGNQSDKLIELAKGEKDPGAAQDRDPQPRADEARPGPLKRWCRSTGRTRRSTSGRTVVNALFLQNNAQGARGPRARREEARR